MWINNPPFVIGLPFSPNAPGTEDCLKEDPIFRILKRDWVSVSEEQTASEHIEAASRKTS